MNRSRFFPSIVLASFCASVLMSAVLVPSLAHADSTSILNLSDSDFTDLSKEFSVNFMHH